MLYCILQIEDLSQQAQVAAAEKFKTPEVTPAVEAGASTTVNCLISYLYYMFIIIQFILFVL